MANLRFIKPICVVDCNFIQQCRSASDDVPSDWDCLLISSVFGELATKDDKERDFLLSRFTSWARRNAGRLWMAKDWFSLITAHEASPVTARRIYLKDFVSWSNTKSLRKYAAYPDGQWTAPLAVIEVREWLERAEMGRSEFVSQAEEFRKLVDAQAGKPIEKLPHTPQAIRAYVQHFNIANAVVPRNGRGRYGDRLWRRQFDCFPDRLLMGRRFRLELYYAIRRALGDARKFENNWDDIHYAVAASYTGHIATRDARLITACEVLSPGVRVFPRKNACS